ncbi:hypothetical protein CCE28_08060 [Anaeromicrobium sediminis]|uniref:peptide-methionine (S)-S-oxide reductase n=1 Tax=Anaeromicrobium sediminis TaxID=1478221 RepID=A0A267MKC4_9FIRM|nr:hypothetical protein CCE28_08060 [Anaeromicrobium sediminis]
MLQGIEKTRVGYAGGTTLNPTYTNIGDHTETIEMEFDGAYMTYEDIMDLFFVSHTPENRTGCTQYKSIIFYHDEEQREVALKKKREFEEKGYFFNTDIVPFERFYLAEFYHQKYYLQKYKVILKEVGANSEDDLINSEKATKLNGHCGGYGTLEDLKRDREKWNFKEETIEWLKKIIDNYNR